MPIDTATATSLASDAQKKVEEELKRKKEEEERLLNAYNTGSQGAYDTSKEAASGLLTGAKSDITGLYDQGYKDLESLIGQQSEAKIKESVRPIEGKLQAQGLLGGPSGALNEALAGAAERVRTEGLGRLADYTTQKTGALASAYGLTAQQLAQLEQQYGKDSQGLLAKALEQRLGTNQQGVDIADKYGTAGLEAALGTNKTLVEQSGQKDLLAEQARLNAEGDASKNALAESQLKTRQDSYDRNFQSLKAQLYNSYRAGGMGDAVATEYANREASKQLGARPT